MDRLYKRVELLTNIAIIVVAVLVSAVLIRSYLLSGGERQSSDYSVAEGKTLVGSKLSLPGIDWAKNSRTLVFALSSSCRYCTESAPLYRQLTQARGETGASRLVAVLPESVNDGQNYIQSLGFSVDEVKQMPLGSMGVKGTPTLIMVNARGVVTNTWEGKLLPPEEKEVLNQFK